MSSTCSFHWPAGGRNGGISKSVLYRSQGSRFRGPDPRFFSYQKSIVCTLDEFVFAFRFLLIQVDALGSEYFEIAVISISKPGEILDMHKQGAMTNLLNLLVNGQEEIMGVKPRYGGPNQQLLPFQYKEEVKRLTEQHEAIGKSLDDILRAGPGSACDERESELASEVAMAVKQDLRESGMSREQFLDALNVALGRTEAGAEGDNPSCKKPITLNMLNNYLSKPEQYAMPTHFLFAIHKVFGSFRVVDTIVGAVGAKVVSGEELRLLAKAQIKDFKDRAARLEKML